MNERMVTATVFWRYDRQQQRPEQHGAWVSYLGLGSTSWFHGCGIVEGRKVQTGFRNSFHTAEGDVVVHFGPTTSLGWTTFRFCGLGQLSHP